MSTQFDRRGAAEARVRRGFLIHLAVFVVVNVGLAVLNMTRNPDNPWFLWVLGGWGLGILLHGACVYLIPNVRKRMVERRAARRDRHTPA